VAALIKPGSVKIVTKEGEIQVSLSIDLNVNLNTDGLLVEKASASLEKNNNDFSSKKVEEKVEWAIPDFDIGPKLEFGKKKEE
jgi:hypothetical protein